MENWKGLPILAERRILYESTLKGYMTRLLALPIFIENQKSYLTERAENAIVLHQFAMANGFNSANNYDIESIIEVYQPDLEVAQSVITLQFKHDWFNGVAIYEHLLKDELMKKQYELNKLLFQQFIPNITKAAAQLPKKKVTKKPAAVKPKAEKATKPVVKAKVKVEEKKTQPVAPKTPVQTNAAPIQKPEEHNKVLEESLRSVNTFVDNYDKGLPELIEKAEKLMGKKSLTEEELIVKLQASQHIIQQEQQQKAKQIPEPTPTVGGGYFTEKQVKEVGEQFPTLLVIFIFLALLASLMPTCLARLFGIRRDSQLAKRTISFEPKKIKGKQKCDKDINV